MRRPPRAKKATAPSMGNFSGAANPYRIASAILVEGSPKPSSAHMNGMTISSAMLASSETSFTRNRTRLSWNRGLKNEINFFGFIRLAPRVINAEMKENSRMLELFNYNVFALIMEERSS